MSSDKRLPSVVLLIIIFFNALFIWQPWLKLFPLQSNKEIKIKFNLP